MYRFLIVSLDYPIRYSHGLVGDYVFHPVIDGERKGGEPHVRDFVVINLSIVWIIPMLAQ